MLAVGLVVVYRTSRIINFAYGETGMLATFFYFDIRLGTNTSTFTKDHGIVLALLVAVAIGAAIGIAMEIAIARPLRSNPTLNGMVGTIAASLLFVTFAVRRWGIEVRPIKPLVEGVGVHVLGLTISPSQLLIGGWALVVIAGLGA